MPTPLIVVVNDDPAFLDMMSDVLIDEGYRVLTSFNVPHALVTIREQQPDLVFLDIRMEKPDAGWTLLHTLRSGADTSKIPVIISSADEHFLAARATQLAAHRVEILEKPFDIDDMIDTIKQILDPSARTS
jgi:CheY-like chemotaxis protein